MTVAAAGARVARLGWLAYGDGAMDVHVVAARHDGGLERWIRVTALLGRIADLRSATANAVMTRCAIEEDTDASGSVCARVDGAAGTAGTIASQLDAFAASPVTSARHRRRLFCVMRYSGTVSIAPASTASATGRGWRVRGALILCPDDWRGSMPIRS